ncbi:hypothetical protein K1T71_006356 [Dendrolimus kikuchii]|uniref:Uncharacterized protein n=1 Tax=Dendrolimus kikuchii TaxID=765133 RepID=A0ACC1D3Q8_9NEOP|nr:hypothetical protein K1T71_006356 [Dendrolimus kikuchii]
MAFKLVRVDSAEPLKIKLPVGKHVIGRGSFFNIDNIRDKRVSRKHAELEVTNDIITIKSLHQNPCFYIKKNIDTTEILKQNDMSTLSNGDKFGILPQTYWYEVIYCTMDDADDTAAESLHSCVDANSESTDIVDESAENADITDCDLTEDNQSSPSVLAPEQPLAINQDQTPTVDAQVSSTSDQTPNKRLHSDDNDEDASKRAKTESPDAVKTEPLIAVVKDEPADGATAGPSNNQGAAANDNVNNNNTPSPPAKQAPPRERCIYGANCYRRNPQHKAQFSHPSDADWGRGDRGTCPYGRDCRKRDPRHWLHHDHPPGVQPPPNAPPPGMRVVEKHGNIFYINANNVNFYDDHFEVEDSEGDSVDYDYEF